MKLRSIAAAAALAVVGVAANAATFSGSFPQGLLFTESTSFAGSGVAFGNVSSFDLYSVLVSPSGFFTPISKVETGLVFAGGGYLATQLFSAGSYYAVATGTGSVTGTYTIAAVPEPETYAMMLAGLGVMGFVAARRKS